MIMIMVMSLVIYFEDCSTFDTLRSHWSIVVSQLRNSCHTDLIRSVPVDIFNYLNNLWGRTLSSWRIDSNNQIIICMLTLFFSLFNHNCCRDNNTTKRRIRERPGQRSKCSNPDIDRGSNAENNLVGSRPCRDTPKDVHPSHDDIDSLEDLLLSSYCVECALSVSDMLEKGGVPVCRLDFQP